MKLMISAATVSFLVAFSMTAASAEKPRSSEATIVERITYGDLDLSTAAGQKRLKDRISFAAYRLCLTDSTASPSPAVADPGCSRGIMDEGFAQMERAVAHAYMGHALAQATIGRH